MEEELEDSAYECRVLLRGLHVQNSNHKRRLKSMKRFKDFTAFRPDVSGGEPWKGCCFYDDDVLYLLTGKTPSTSSDGLVCGLLAACGEVSSSSSSVSSPIRESESTVGGLGVVKLKRSAADAIKLLFY